MCKKVILLIVIVLSFTLVGCNNKEKVEENKEIVEEVKESNKEEVTESIAKEDNNVAIENIANPNKENKLENAFPQPFIDKLKQAVENNDEENVLEKIKIGKELSKEEFEKYTKVEIDEMNYRESYLVDIDNDGTEDIVSLEYYGGSLGNADIVIYKGNSTGGFSKTTSYETSITGKFGFITYENINYEYKYLYNFESKNYTGITIYYYENGKRKEAISIYHDFEKYNKKIEQIVDEKYKDMANNALDKYNYSDLMEEVVIGAAEYTKDNKFYCDLNNDGIEESYTKDIWYTTSRTTVDHLIYNIDSFEEGYLEKILEIKDVTPMMFWVEKVDNTNIICMLYKNSGLDDYSIYGYKIYNGNYETVFKASLSPVHVTTVKEISEESLNYKPNY